ncbi:MAG: hypothetical protein COB73_00885 [Flavobacteriaceae bacterium]|nr:MAG: hypothetical protein COB73_00885 [Flavobacteriaceae bacterium]
MTYKELSKEQMEMALEIDKFTCESPHNIQTRMRLHAEVGRLYSSSIRKRKMRSDLLKVEVKFTHQQFISKL